MKEPIKLYDYFNSSSHCNFKCENYFICKKGLGYENHSKFEIDTQISKITQARFLWENNCLLFQEPVEQEAIASIKNAYGIKVIAEKVVPSYSERILTNG